MTNKEFTEIMGELQCAYGEKRFPLTTQTARIWAKYLAGYPREDVQAAVEDSIRGSEYPPTIAELLRAIRKIAAGRVQQERELWENYTQLVAAYPGGADTPETRKAFSALAGGSDARARVLLARGRAAVRGWELNGTKEIPSLVALLGRWLHE